MINWDEDDDAFENDFDEEDDDIVIGGRNVV